ncbi:DUF374 domain-containing protein [Stieleria varia]|uniref:DUF374 domain-containing protein n=1 Tax=Stieleria varia TaxID=2528005 RepID=A0A5C6A076_9BACT|nr:DUF374 domain-containing protein [Stieleria varia]TWT92816.1 hypothetical protein Pla52n_61810 [Stieleria varia]
MNIKRLLPWLIGVVVLGLRWTCRVRYHNDLRAKLKSQGTPYIYVGLHAHQLGAIIAAEPGTGAMVSRSLDGELIVNALQHAKCVPVRGSGGRASKGGASAFRALVEHVENGQPAFLAVDGPRGPRGKVYPGAAKLSQKTRAAVLIAIAIPSRRIVIKKAWDRLQIPLPFSRVEITFCDPLFPQLGESVEDFSARIEWAIADLERQLDPAEAPDLLNSEPIELPRAA